MCTDDVRECLNLSIFAAGALWILFSAALGRWVVRRARRQEAEIVNEARHRALKIVTRAEEVLEHSLVVERRDKLPRDS